MVSFLKPKYDPTNTRGVDTPNHSNVNASREVKGACHEMKFISLPSTAT